MTPKNNVRLDGHEGLLLCPNKCGGINLHQSKVEVWNRAEDDSKGNHIVIEKDEILGDDDMSENPSPRRQGLSIDFTCEECSYDNEGKPNGTVFTLEVIQHKGSTYLMWKSA